MNNTKGFSLLELMVGVLVLSVVLGAGYLVFFTGQSMWSTTDTQIQIQESLRRTLLRISKELHESGEDSTGVLQVVILDGVGANGSDVLQFAVPVCPCGRSVHDQNGEIAYWGAPLDWRDTECNEEPPVDQNGQVTICHFPPLNPTNPQTLLVLPSEVNAHLAHDDYIGACGTCVINTNKYIEYQLNNNDELTRRVLDGTLAPIKEEVFAHRISDLQVSLSADKKIVTLTVSGSGSTNQKRQINMTRSLDVKLWNKT